MNYNSNKPNEKTKTNAPIVDIGALIFVIYSKNLKNTQYWYRWWDSNPHGFPPDFESGASANSATRADAIGNRNAAIKLRYRTTDSRTE